MYVWLANTAGHGSVYNEGLFQALVLTWLLED